MCGPLGGTQQGRLEKVRWALVKDDSATGHLPLLLCLFPQQPGLHAPSVAPLGSLLPESQELRRKSPQSTRQAAGSLGRGGCCEEESIPLPQEPGESHVHLATSAQ